MRRESGRKINFGRDTDVHGAEEKIFEDHPGGIRARWENFRPGNR